jgi:hypothetical protein
LEGHPIANVTLDPLDDYLVIEPLDESELPSGLIVPANEATQVQSGIVAAVGPDVTLVDPATRCSSRARPASKSAWPARRIESAC